MNYIRENICPQNATCQNVKNCSVAAIEIIGYGAPVQMIEKGKCNYCDKCKSTELKSCSLNGD